MYCVKTYVDKSPIHGLGVFAGEDIAKGTKVWEFVDGFDRTISEEDVLKLPQQAQDYLDTYAYMADGKFCLCGDHGIYTNHSETPNSGSDNGSDYQVALRNIKKGEEITSDYREFDDTSKQDKDNPVY